MLGKDGMKNGKSGCSHHTTSQWPNQTVKLSIAELRVSGEGLMALCKDLQ